MSKGSSRKKTLLIVIVVFLAGMVAAGLFGAALEHTNRMEFCTDCHSMQIPLSELKENVHFKNASGVQATCHNCHVPEPFFPKMLAKIMAAKDVYHELLGTIDTPEKYEAHRWDMASRVWAKMEATDSRECRSCHDFANMDLTEQDRSARSKHGNAPDKTVVNPDGSERPQTCIDCHKGIAHEEPDEPDDLEEEEEDSDSA